MRTGSGPPIFYLQETHLTYNNIVRLKVKGIKLCCKQSNESRRAILILDSLQSKKAKYERQRRVLIKKFIYHKNIANLHAHAPNNIVARYVRPKLIKLKGETDIFTATVEHFNTLTQRFINQAGVKPARIQKKSATPSINKI